ncbi:ketoacyl-synt-domain-containing protein [Xylariaceae sp. FL0662B]|nr:ketoacyl-synt-domain-containing protein [Xylariaceae sp. FL0662B]
MAPMITEDIVDSTPSTPLTPSSEFNGYLPNGHTLANDVASPEPIAIIGMGCRLPGGSSSPSKLWDLLKTGISAQGRFPPSRFNIDGFYHPNSERPGSLNTEGGYFIDEDIRGFDNSFFGINNLEATYMDPQQRKLLEVVFECFENAGLPLEKISGTNVGCYVGNFVTDFITMQLKDSEYAHRYTATGLGTTILANRISHVFNLLGPSSVIDTACSSSLYCLHAACTALLAGECDSAVVAGANLIQSPEQQLATMKAGVLSKTSTCHTFDSSADGYGRADGIGALLVKRLSDAIRDGDVVRAVIRGTAVNSNGRTNGITLPSADGQEAVIRKAYAQARLGYEETSYVECHGTGTAVGDPIEVEAVSRVFKRPEGSPLLIGSVKSYLGHSEAASGISSIIKVVLALEKKEIPPTVGVNSINPKIKLDDWNIQIVTQMTPWPQNSSQVSTVGIRRAGINSFGYGGANAHAILEAAEHHLPQGCMSPSAKEVATPSRTMMLLPVSANNDTALKRRVVDLSKLDLGRVSITDLAYTLGVKRSHLSARGYILASPGTLKEDLVLENTHTRVEGKPYLKLPLAFVFTGQGAQWAEMGAELIHEFPSFRQTIQMLDSTLQLLPHPPDWTLLGALLEPAKTSMIDHASRSQPVCTAVQVAVVRLLSTCGVKPERVVGHSSGEIAAAYATGHVTAEQAITIAYYRGYTVTKSHNAMVGAMMAAGLGRTDAQEHISTLGLDNQIRVACVNSPESITISGDVDGINKFREHLETLSIFARLLKTDGKAYHSHHMAAVGQEYEQYLISAASAVNSPATNGHLLSSSEVQWISSVTEEVVGKRPVGPSYWRANLESPVLFSNVVEKLLQDLGPHHLVEIGPHSALEMPIKQIRTKLNMGEDKVHYGAALSRGKNSVITFLNLVGALYLHGHSISFQDVNVAQSWPLKTKGSHKRQQETMLLDLPNYAWDHDSQHLINEPRVSVEWRNRKNPRHDILGSQINGGNGITTIWRNVLKAKDVPWVEGHKLDTTIVFPAAGYLAMAIEAMRQVATIEDVDESCALRLRDVTITKALVLGQEANDAGVEIFTTLQPAQLPGHSETEWHQFNISSYAGEEATVHAKGLVQLAKALDYTTAPSLPIFKPEGMEPSAPRTWYNKFAEGGLNFQGRFQSLSQINLHRKREDMHVLAKTELRQKEVDDKNPESKYMLHPVTIDSLFQAGIIASTSGVVRELRAKVPVHIEEMIIRPHTPGQSIALGENDLNIKAVSEPVGFGTIRVSAELYGDDGRPVLQISRCRQVAYQSGIQQQDDGDERHPMLRVIWKPDVARLGPSDRDAFSSYIEQQAACAATSNAKDQDTTLIRLGTALDLLVHKNARLRILNLFGGENEENYFVEILRLATAFKRCRSLWRGSYSENGAIQFVEYSSDDKSPRKQSSGGDGSVFDLVLLGSLSDAARSTDFAAIKDLIAENGTLLSIAGSGEVASLEKLGFTTLQTQLRGDHEMILARPPRKEIPEKKKASVTGDVLIVERNAHHSLNSALATQVYRATGCQAKRVALEQVTPSLLGTHAAVIATIELEDPTLSRLTEDEMRLIKVLTDNCTNLIWVTGGKLLQGAKPEMAVAFGLSRALMLEQPSLRFFIVDVDVNADTNVSDMEKTARHVVEVLQQAVEDPEPDFEFVQAAGMLHVSRFAPSERKNRVFREKQGGEKMALPLSKARPFRLDTEKVGHTDGIFFRREEAYSKVPLAAGDVEVSVMAIGLNTRDHQAISGNAKNSSGSTCTFQYSAVVSKVGPGVESLALGDRVVVMAPGNFASKERVAEWACHKLNDNEGFTSMACLPLPLSTAIYAIESRARLQPNESILICCGSNDTGADLVAIRIAQVIGSQVFAITTTKEDQEQLVHNFKLPQDQVFVANDPELDAKLLAATRHRGLDVIVAFTDDKLPITMSNRSIIGALCVDCARLVQVGVSGPGLVDAVVMDPSMLRRNVTMTAFDMGSLITLQTPDAEKMRRRLLSDAMSLYRRGDLGTIDLAPNVWDISAVREAFDAIASTKTEKRPHNGGVVVSLENDASSVPVLPIKYDSVFSPDKTYLLVGCLGGLGRSISRWMLSRGARKFVFMGRSGIDKAPARRLVEDLQFSGAQVTVIRGDVVNFDDVERAVASINGAVGGVIQAAMGLDEALFTTMSRQYWLNGLKPKVVGSWNLHNAIRGRDHELDFFLMTSSVSGSVGTATESNYCSANYFLDVFARYRRGLGLPATSLGLGMISEVGYLHENPEIEALLLRKGIQAINEDEMLHIIDIALSQQTAVPTTLGDAYDELGLGHVLTGLEPLGLKLLRAKGFEGTSPVLGDPRASLLSAALDDETLGSGSGSSGSTNGLAAEIAEAIESGGSVEEAALKMIVTKFSSLVLMPKDKIDVYKPISGVGIDSMLAAEFRAWIFQAFKVDVPYLTLLSSTATLSALSELITQSLMKARENGA